MKKQKEKQEFADIVRDQLEHHTSSIYVDVKGKLYTLLESIISNEKQLQSAKDVADQLILSSLSKKKTWAESHIASLIYEYEHRNDNVKPAKLPWYHTTEHYPFADKKDVDYTPLFENAK